MQILFQTKKREAPLRDLSRLCIPEWKKCEPRIAEWVVLVYRLYTEILSVPSGY